MNNDITRSIDDMNVIITKIKGYRVFTFFYNAIKVWNALPLECKELILNKNLRNL